MSEPELLRHLVALDSTSALPNGPIVDFLSGCLDRPGVELIRHPSETEGKTNLIVWAGPAESADGKGLVLSGHLDTVPALEGDWRTDPFTLAADEANYYGRGTADMKGFVAICAAATAKRDPGSLRHPLVLILTCDEEIGTLGAASLARTWPAERKFPRAAVIGEPTSLRVVRMHKGHLKLRLEVRGTAAHSGYPHLGRNAIEIAARAIAALTNLRRELERERPANHEHFGEVPYVSLNVATIHGGAAINVIPDLCAVELGLRVLPGVDPAALTERVRDAVTRVTEGEEIGLSLLNSTPPMLAQGDSPIHSALSAAMKQDETVAVSFATDAGWLQGLGMDTVLFGPGAIEVAHRANEFIPKDEIGRARGVVDQLIDQFCL